jgi:hypothetical protein
MTDAENEIEVPDSFLTRLRRIDAGSVFALLVGSAAILIASLPSVAFLSKPLSVTALLIALAGSMAPALWRRTALVWPVVVSLLSLGALLFAGSWPEGRPPPAPPLVAIPLKEKGMVAHQPIDASEWINAAEFAVKAYDLRVQLVSVRLGTVEFEPQGKKSFSSEKYLVVQVRVGYDGAAFQPIPYEPWIDLADAPSKVAPTLTDSANKSYAQKTFSSKQQVVGRGGRSYLTPGRQVNEVLVYPLPMGRVEYLRLELPAAAFGRKGTIRFQIPWTFVTSS